MKKYLLFLLLSISIGSVAQTVQLAGYNPVTGLMGEKYTQTITTLPNTPFRYFNGYGNFVSFQDSARRAISLTTNNTSGAATYDNTTGVLNIPQYSGGGGGGTVTGGSITWPLMFASPTTATVASGVLTYAPTLASQSAYTVLGNHTGSTATPTFGQVHVRAINATGSTYDGTKYLSDDGTWKTVSSGGGSGTGWLTTGNAGLVAGTNFLGTTDNVDVIFKRGNIFSGMISNANNNTSFGISAFNLAATGNANSAFGSSALTANTTGINNSAFGRNSLNANSTGINNSAFGVNSLASNTSGAESVALGGALAANTTGSYNVAVGSQALLSNTTSSEMVAVGWTALKQNTTGTGNTAVGSRVLQSLITGTNNTGLGTYSLYSATASNNTALGYVAQENLTTGTGNTSVGVQSLHNNLTGVNNTAVGFQAGFNLGGSYNTFIGSGLTSISNAVSNNIILADGQGKMALWAAPGSTVASASAIVPPSTMFHVTGTTTITSITSTGVAAGARLTLIFDGALTFTDGSNLKLNGDFVTTADDTITLVFDGTNFYETARSVN